jgi:hypothetical protein
MSLAALGASVNISMRSLVFHRRNWKWPAVSLERVQGIRFVIFSTGNRVRKGRAVLTVLQLVVAMRG